MNSTHGRLGKQLSTNQHLHTMRGCGYADDEGVCTAGDAVLPAW